MNFTIKRYWFRRTNRGGGKGGGNRLEPMAQWLQGRFIWMMGYDYDHMLKVVKNVTAADLDDIEDRDDML